MGFSQLASCSLKILIDFEVRNQTSQGFTKTLLVCGSSTSHFFMKNRKSSLSNFKHYN